MGMSWWPSGEDSTASEDMHSIPGQGAESHSCTAWLKKQNVEENSVCNKDPIFVKVSVCIQIFVL